MKIMEAKISDIDEVYELGKSVDEFNVCDETTTFWPKDILKNCVKSTKDKLILVKDNQKIIGFLIANNNSTFKKVIIENIYISPNYRDKWIGKMLMDFTIENLKIGWCEYVCLLVERNNKAIGFYKKNGFNQGSEFVWMDKILNEKFRKL